MTLHTRIFGLNLGLILLTAFVGSMLFRMMLMEQYFNVILFFGGMATGDYLDRTKK